MPLCVVGGGLETDGAGLVPRLEAAGDHIELLWTLYEDAEDAAEEGRLGGADAERWWYWLLMLLMLLGPLLSKAVNWFVSGEVTLLPLLLLAVIAISALILSRSTSAAWDFLSVFLTKLVMITLQRMSTSSRR